MTTPNWGKLIESKELRLFPDQNVFRTYEKRNGNGDHDRNFPYFHLIQAQNQHYRDNKKYNIYQIARNSSKFWIFKLFYFRAKLQIGQPQKEDEYQKIFWIEVGADNAGQNEFRDKQNKISGYRSS
jgi:hypothetical protein